MFEFFEVDVLFVCDFVVGGVWIYEDLVFLVCGLVY